MDDPFFCVVEDKTKELTPVFAKTPKKMEFIPEKKEQPKTFLKPIIKKEEKPVLPKKRYQDPKARLPSMLNDIEPMKPLKINPNKPPGSFLYFSQILPSIPKPAKLYD